MASIVLDTRAFPLVVSRFPATWEAADLDAYFAALVALHDREQPFVHISDISLAADMSRADTRKKAAAFMVAMRARSARLCRGAVQIAPGAVMRGAITAIQWFSPPPYPHAVVASFDEAFTWAKACADNSGLMLPSTAGLPRL